MEKNYQERWTIIRGLGEGGQGTVHEVLDKSQFDLHKINAAIANVAHAGLHVGENEQLREIKAFREAIADVIRMDDPNTHGALKVLHAPDKAKDPERSEERLKREIEAMSAMSHPNLLEILDADPDHKWFVSKLYPGSLTKQNPFIGNFVEALKAFRPLAQGVAKLHEKGQVHRDIKPHNVFIDLDDNLVLGDFGLVFSRFDEDTRLSAIEENVGSRAWMPPWAMERRIDEIKPSFDVFSLGKLLWAMVSGSVLNLWYYDRPENNLEHKFPEAPHIKHANWLFSKCIVQEEEDCLPSAGELLIHVDNTLSLIDKNADLIRGRPNVERKCKVCGLGTYGLDSDRGNTDGMNNFGLSPGPTQFKIFICNICGHVQLFAFSPGQERKIWKEEDDSE